MARANMAASRIRPEVSELLRLQVVRRERISEHFARVTLGGGDVGRFRSLGFDQWFRLFIPVAEDSLTGLPDKLTTLAYVKYMAMSKSVRPVLRNYSVRAYRPDGETGPELDVDFVLHGDAADGTQGPAATWAQQCRRGDVTAIIDEGVSFNPAPSIGHVVLVADESGLPAAASVLASLPAGTRGRALIEVPTADDRQDVVAPAGVEVTWLVRDDRAAVPGRAALAAAEALPVPDEPFYGWTVGEHALPTRLRRHWVRAGVPKENILFCGYWKATGAH